MLTRMRLGLAIAVLAAAGTMSVCAAQERDTSLKPPDKTVLALPEIKQLLLLMDTDKNGKISKQEWMNFMSAEFDRLDKDKSGELDVKELAASRVRATHITNVGK